MTTAAATALIVSTRDALPYAFVAVAVICHVPAAVGVPLMVAPERDRPGGSVPLVDHVIGVNPVAVSVCEYAVPTVPDASAVLVMTGARLDAV